MREECEVNNNEILQLFYWTKGHCWLSEFSSLKKPHGYVYTHAVDNSALTFDQV